MSDSRYGEAVNPAAGTVYIAGVTQSIPFSSGDGTNHVISGNGAWTMFLAKYDANGNFQWAELNAASPNSVGLAVAVDAQDNAYTVGWLENTTTFFSADGHNITITGFSPGQSDGNYPDDIYLAKYDANGNVKWVNHIGGYKAIPAAVTVGPSGEISLAGFVGNINYGWPGEARPSSARSLPERTSTWAAAYSPTPSTLMKSSQLPLPLG